MKLISKIKSFVGYHFYYAYKFTKNRSRSELYKYYNETAPLISSEFEQTLIVMIDGKMKHGGISDRLRGIVSIFHYARIKGFGFKIYHSYPFPLNNYLEPNLTDWIIQGCELIYDLKYSKPVFLESLNIPLERWTQKAILDLNTNDNKIQYHIYTNIDLSPKYFSEDFKHLFKPHLKLESELNKHLNLIGYKYISVTLRFQQLLGDFKEGDYPVLNEDEKYILINNCINAISRLHSQYGSHKILVTSDSSTFLEKVLKLPYVYVISGELVHMDYTNDSLFDVHLKSFTDMFMISKANKAFLLLTGQMYRSGFAHRASMITGINYKIIEF